MGRKKPPKIMTLEDKDGRLHNQIRGDDFDEVIKKYPYLKDHFERGGPIDLIPIDKWDFPYNPREITHAQLQTFLDHLALTGNQAIACRKSDINIQTIKFLRNKGKVFNGLCEQAIEYASGILEQEARRRAVAGVQKPVFYKGVKCGEITEYSDRILEFLLQGADPHRYGRWARETGMSKAPPINITIQQFSDGKVLSRQEVSPLTNSGAEDAEITEEQDEPAEKYVGSEITVQLASPDVSDPGMEPHGEGR